MRRALVSFCFVIAGSDLVACSDGTAGTTGGAPVNAEPFTPPAKGRIGAVNVFVRPESPGASSSFFAAAYFLDYSAVRGSPPDGYSRGTSRAIECTKRASAGCELVRCKLAPDSTFALATPNYVSAGEITVKRASGAELKMTPDAQNTYNASSANPPAIAAGETVTITAAGAAVPAFSEAIPFLSQVVPASTRVEAAAGSDAEVAWTGGTTGKVVVLGETGDEAKGFVAQLTCRFDAVAGKGTIPGGLLVEMSGNDFSLGVAPDVTTKTFGAYEVGLIAQTSGELSQNGITLSIK